LGGQGRAAGVPALPRPAAAAAGHALARPEQRQPGDGVAHAVRIARASCSCLPQPPRTVFAPPPATGVPPVGSDESLISLIMMLRLEAAPAMLRCQGRPPIRCHAVTRCLCCECHAAEKQCLSERKQNSRYGSSGRLPKADPANHHRRNFSARTRRLYP
jgi:hypothetical protein